MTPPSRHTQPIFRHNKSAKEQFRSSSFYVESRFYFLLCWRMTIHPSPKKSVRLVTLRGDNYCTKR
jgi:hypothetical protein